MIDLDEILPDLDPPPNGLRTLRARLDRRRRPPWAVGALVLAVAVAALGVLRPTPAPPIVVDAGLAGWTGPLGPPVQAGSGTAVERVPAAVVWYRVDGILREP